MYNHFLTYKTTHVKGDTFLYELIAIQLIDIIVTYLKLVLIEATTTELFNMITIIYQINF